MAARRTAGKGDVRTRDSRPVDGPALSAHRDGDEYPATNPAGIRTQNTLLRSFIWFTEHDTGHLKVRRAADSEALHLTWTWSWGVHAGTYVYVRVEYFQAAMGLELLKTKVLEVELGDRKPTHDKYSR